MTSIRGGKKNKDVPVTKHPWTRKPFSSGSQGSGFVPGQTVNPGSINLGSQPSGVATAHNPENVWWPYKEGSNASRLIWQLLNNSNQGGSLSQGYSDVLSELRRQYEAGGAVNPDLVMSLFNNLLSYQTTQDQRQYDYGMLQEGRLYNSPTNELARLMGSGISRDAALQILQGAGAGSGSAGSDAIQMMGMTGSAGSAAAYGTQNQNSLFNTVFNGVNTFAGLVNMGFNMAQSFAQTQMLSLSNAMSQNQLSAYDATGAAFGLLQSLGASEDDYKNVDSVGNFLIGQANSGNVEAAQFINSGKLSAMRRNAPFSTNYMKSMFENEHSSDMYIQQMENLVAQTGYVQQQTNLISSELDKNSALIDQIYSSTSFIEQQTATCKQLESVYTEQANLLKKNGKVAEADELLKKAQKFQLDLQNVERSSFLFGNTDDIENTSPSQRTGLQWLTLDSIYNVTSKALISGKTTNPSYTTAVYESMFNNAQAVSYAMTLESMKSQLGIKFAQQCPTLFNEWSILKTCGAYDYLHSVTEGRVTTSNSVGPYTYQNVNYDYDNEFNQYRGQIRKLK